MPDQRYNTGDGLTPVADAVDHDLEKQHASLTRLLCEASWPDGGHDGFPSRRVASMIADHLLDSGVRVRLCDE